MPKTISFHTGAVWSRGHNIRDERYTSKQEHIDSSLTANNVTIRDVPVRQAYDEIFGQAVEEYNAKQKRADRRIDSYYDKIKQDKRKHPVYECIVQIGDRTDTGNSAELEKQALIRYAEEWEKRNPNLRLIGAYIHADEPNGTVHLHCDFIPVAECSRGMRLQNSYDKALQQQGFKSENIHQTAQIEWQFSEREALTAICRDLGIDAQHSQGIGKGREYLTPREYQRAKDRMTEQIETELQPLRDEMQEYIEMQTPIRAVQLEQKKIPFSKRVSVDSEELSVLTRQARTYTANKKAISTLKKDQQELAQGQQELAKAQDLLEKDRAAFEEERKNALAAIADEREKVRAAMERQRNLNELLVQTERAYNAEKKKSHDNFVAKLNLQHELGEKEKVIQELQGKLKTALETIRGAYESLTNVVKAVGMLKYDKDEGYAVGLSERQGRLIDAIANYGARWAKDDGHPDLAEKMKKTIGISEGIQDDIDALAPKRSRGRGGMSL